MPQRPAWAPDEVDLERPAAARTRHRAAVPCSHLALGRVTGYQRPDRARRTEDLHQKSRNAMTFRNSDQTAEPPTGYGLVPPGGDVKRYSGYSAVGHRA